MIQVNQEFKTLMQTRTDFLEYATMTLQDGTVFNLGPSDFTVNNNTIVDGADADTLPLGSAIEKIIQIELINPNELYNDYTFYGATVDLVLKFQLSNSIAELTRGRYTVIEPATYGDTIIITAADEMHKADTPISGTITFPINLASLLSSVCTTTGITLGTTTFQNSTFTVNKFSGELKEHTYRELIGWVAQLAGGNARINYNNQLEIMSYSKSTMLDMYDVIDNEETPDEDLVLKNWSSLKLEIDDVEITGIEVKLESAQLPEGSEDTEVSVLTGTRDYVLQINNNPFFNSDNVNTYIAAIGSLLIGLKFRPFEGDHISNPLLEFMDAVYIKNRRESVYPTIITDIDYTVLGYTVLKNSAEPKLRNGKSYTSEVRQSYLNTVNNTDKKVREVNNYFWHDNAGAHVSTVEKDATTGPNVLVDSDSLDIRNGTDTLASFGEEIRLGKEGESAQANFSAAGMQFKNESGDVIAKMLSTEALIGTIDIEEVFTSYIPDGSTIHIQLVGGEFPLSNIVFESVGNSIHYSIYTDKFAIFDARDTNHDGSYAWYHLDNNTNVYTVHIGENGAMTGMRIFGTISYGDTLPLYIQDTATLVKDEIVNGQRTYTNIQTVYIIYTINYSAETEKLSFSIRVQNLPSELTTSAYKKSGWGFGDYIRGKATTTINHQASAGYAPEYVFGLKKAGQDSQAYAFIAGEQNYANAQHQAIFGKFNDPDSNHAFEIGNGTDDENRSNAFAVDWNGNVEANNLVTNVAYNSTTKALTKTINNVTSNIVALSTLADALEPLITGLVYKGAITAFNDAQTGGYYTYASSATNRPPLNAGGTCLVLKNGNFITQICFPNRSSSTATPTFYIRRTYAADSWQAWYQIVPTATS